MFSEIKKYKFTITWTALIIILLLIPAKQISKSEILIPHIDKIIHFGIFSLWGIIFQTETKSKFRVLYTVLIGSGFAVVSEFAQKYLTTTRTFDYFDILADFIGIIISIFIFRFYEKFRNRVG